MKRTRIGVRKPLGGDHRAARFWEETRTWGYPAQQSRGLAPFEGRDAATGRMVVERVARGTAVENDIVVFGTQFFRVVGIVESADNVRVVDLEVDQVQGEFPLAVDLTFGGDDLVFDEDVLVGPS